MRDEPPPFAHNVLHFVVSQEDLYLQKVVTLLVIKGLLWSLSVINHLAAPVNTSLLLLHN